MQIRIPRRPVCDCRPSKSSSTPLTRYLHGSAPAKPIPTPIPFVPDIPTFLKLIGRQTSQHASKFPSWESFFQNQSSVLRASGIEPARTRRYLLWWRERYRRGDFGIGGDLAEVTDGVAEARIAQRDGKQVVVNSRPEDTEADLSTRRTGVGSVKIVQPGVLSGPFWKVKKGTLGTVATIQVQEGMWEEKRGHKVKGGERKRKLQIKIDRIKQAKEERDQALGLI